MARGRIFASKKYSSCSNQPISWRAIMVAISPRLSPCLWFDDQAEEAAHFYVGIFKNSRITRITRCNVAG